MRKVKKIATTSSLTKVSQCVGFLMGQEDEQMGLISGEAGVGKTTAAQFVCDQEGGIFITAMPFTSPFALLTQILTSLGCEAERSYYLGFNKAIEKLSLRQSPLFIDEADFLCDNPKLLEIVRTLGDQAQIPIILIGMKGIEKKIAGRKLLLGRIQYFLDFLACNFDDVELIAEARCSVKIKADLLKQIYSQTKGNTREIKRVLSHIESFAKPNQLSEVGIDEWGDKQLLPSNSQILTGRRKAA
jgi:DNA transposition AAA+ family ATPase